MSGTGSPPPPGPGIRYYHNRKKPRKTEMEYVISNKTSLEKLENDKSLKQTVRHIKIELSNDTDLSEYERQLNRHYFSCGCETGSFMVFLTVLAGFVIWLTDIAPTIWVWWKILIILFLSALLGKITGLCISKIKCRCLLKKLKLICETVNKSSMLTKA